MQVNEYLNLLKVMKVIENDGISPDNFKVIFDLIGEEVTTEKTISILQNNEFREYCNRTAYEKLKELKEKYLQELKELDLSPIMDLKDRSTILLESLEKLIKELKDYNISIDTANFIKLFNGEFRYTINDLYHMIITESFFTTDKLKKQVIIIENDLREHDNDLYDLKIRHIDFESDDTIDIPVVLDLILKMKEIIKFISEYNAKDMKDYILELHTTPDTELLIVLYNRLSYYFCDIEFDLNNMVKFSRFIESFGD